MFSFCIHFIIFLHSHNCICSTRDSGHWPYWYFVYIISSSTFSYALDTSFAQKASFFGWGFFVNRMEEPPKVMHEIVPIAFNAVSQYFYVNISTPFRYVLFACWPIVKEISMRLFLCNHNLVILQAEMVCFLSQSIFPLGSAIILKGVIHPHFKLSNSRRRKWRWRNRTKGVFRNALVSLGKYPLVVQFQD